MWHERPKIAMLLHSTRKRFLGQILWYLNYFSKIFTFQSLFLLQGLLLLNGLHLSEWFLAWPRLISWEFAQACSLRNFLFECQRTTTCGVHNKQSQIELQGTVSGCKNLLAFKVLICAYVRSPLPKESSELARSKHPTQSPSFTLWWSAPCLTSVICPLMWWWHLGSLSLSNMAGWCRVCLDWWKSFS